VTEGIHYYKSDVRS